MKQVVLCVDRDDDFGEKGGVISPVIGRQENLNAVIALGLADPEDSDTNSVLGALQTYDQMVEQGEDVEIATICGDKKVGRRSDEVIATQLDIVLNEIEPSGLILVTDGAEDEHILPIITSRIKVNGIRRIVVKQQKSIENTYYLITRLMDDEKIQKKFMLPVVVLILLWAGISLISKFSDVVPDFGITVIVLAVAGFLLVRIYHLEEPVVKIATDFKRGVEKGYLSSFASILALLVIVYGIAQTWQPITDDPQSTRWEIGVMIMRESLWYILAAGMLFIFGKALDVYIRKGYFLKTTWLALFTLTGFVILTSAGVDLAGYYLGMNSDFEFSRFALKFVFGMVVLVIGKLIYNYIRSSKKSPYQGLI